MAHKRHILNFTAIQCWYNKVQNVLLCSHVMGSFIFKILFDIKTLCNASKIPIVLKFVFTIILKMAWPRVRNYFAILIFQVFCIFASLVFCAKNFGTFSQFYQKYIFDILSKITGPIIPNLVRIIYRLH